MLKAPFGWVRKVWADDTSARELVLWVARLRSHRWWHWRRHGGHANRAVGALTKTGPSIRQGNDLDTPRGHFHSVLREIG